MTCPLCQHHYDDTRDRIIKWPYLSALALELARRIGPTWEPKDGCCQVCLDALVENAARAEKEPSRCRRT